MRAVAMAVAVLALLALPASAQMGGSKRGGPPPDDTAKTDDRQKKADDRAYQDALKRIPDSKEKYDPWAVTKPSDTDKKPSK